MLANSTMFHTMKMVPLRASTSLFSKVLSLISNRLLLIVEFCDFLGSLFGYRFSFIFRISPKLVGEMYHIVYQIEALRICQEPNSNYFTKYSFFLRKKGKNENFSVLKWSQSTLYSANVKLLRQFLSFFFKLYIK